MFMSPAVQSLLILSMMFQGGIRQDLPVHPATDPDPRPQDTEWTSLLDGDDASRHWRVFNGVEFPDNWTLESGVLFCRGGGRDIITREQYDDFELSLEWRISPGGNSGIFFNVAEGPSTPWQTGPEMQILDNAAAHGGSTSSTSAGSNYALHAPSSDVARPVGEYNEVLIRVLGNRVTHSMNGQVIVEYELYSEQWESLVAESKFGKMPGYGRRLSGHIALQDHGDAVWFRNIRIRRLKESPPHGPEPR